jgi:hypothetical protein
MGFVGADPASGAGEAEHRTVSFARPARQQALEAKKGGFQSLESAFSLQLSRR